MITNMQSHGVALPAPTGRNATPGPIDLSGAGDLYAVWKSVFERARAAQSATNETRGSQGLDAAGDRGLRDGGAQRMPQPLEGSASRERSGSAAACAPAGLGAGQATTAVVAQAATEDIATAARSGARIDAPALAAPTILPGGCTPFGAPPPGTRMADGGSACETARGSQAVQRLSSAPAQAAAADSVSVFVQGSAVAIVVRDAAISEPDALRCGFETARALTGQGAGLVQLTLNGRHLYRQPGASPFRPAQSGSALVFAC